MTTPPPLLTTSSATAIFAGLSRDYTAAAGHFRRAITIAAATGDVMTQAVGVGGLVLALAFLGEVSEARRLIPEAIQRAERLGNPTILTAVYEQAGAALARIGEPQEAAAMFKRGLVHADAGGPIVATTLRVHYALSVDDPHEAARIMRAAIPIARQHLAGSWQSAPLLGAAKIAVRRGSDRTAARLLGAFMQHGASFAMVPEEYERLVSQLTGRLGAATFEDELRLGGELSMGGASQLAEDVVASTA